MILIIVKGLVIVLVIIAMIVAYKALVQRNKRQRDEEELRLTSGIKEDYNTLVDLLDEKEWYATCPQFASDYEKLEGKVNEYLSFISEGATIDALKVRTEVLVSVLERANRHKDVAREVKEVLGNLPDRHLPEYDLLRADLYNSLGVSYYESGLKDAGRDMFRLAVQEVERLHGKLHAELEVPLRNLGAAIEGEDGLESESENTRAWYNAVKQSDSTEEGG